VERRTRARASGEGEGDGCGEEGGGRPSAVCFEKNSIDVVQLYGCGAQGTLYLYSENITITQRI
jgi:hypothetical protein